MPFDQSKIAEYAEKFMCKICLENEVNCILVECGHAMCKTCYDRLIPSGGQNELKEKRCAFCREPARNVVPLFLVQARPAESRGQFGPTVPFQQSKIAEYAEKFKCEKCKVNEVNFFFPGCGHRICKTCYDNIKPSGQPSVIRCPLCSKPASIVPLFLVGGYKQKYLKYKKKYLELKNKFL